MTVGSSPVSFAHFASSALWTCFQSCANEAAAVDNTNRAIATARRMRDYHAAGHRLRTSTRIVVGNLPYREDIPIIPFLPIFVYSFCKSELKMPWLFSRGWTVVRKR